MLIKHKRRKHIEPENYISTKYKCDHCKENLVKMKRLKHHMKKLSDVNNAFNVANIIKLKQIT